VAGAATVPDLPGIEGLQLVGRGGFAVVYRGRQPAFQRDVAVKVIERSGLDGEDRHRFDRECKAMGSISDHPGIVTLYDAAFTSDGRPYLVMPYIADGTLRDRLAQDGPMAWQQVAELGVQLAGALETAHRAGVLHRDVKPDNVLRSPYGGQLADFGIARIQGGHETRSGLVTGSLAHAAPEILDGSAPTAQGDVYSLASTLFEALAGRPPFVRGTDEALVAMMRRVITEAPPDLTAHGVPDALARVLARGMEKDPAQRYPSAEAFGHALQDAELALGGSASSMAVVGDPSKTVIPPADGTTPVLDEAQPPLASTGAATGATRQAVTIAAVLMLLLGIGVTAFVMFTDGGGGGGSTSGSAAVSSAPIVTSAAVGPAATAAPPTSASVDTTLGAFAQLEQFVTIDQPRVDLLAERWVPQLSAKREGLIVDGISFGYSEILDDHRSRRDAFGAIVADGGTYNFRTDNAQMNGWYITLVPVAFDRADQALAWCLDQGLDREDCFAKFISSTVIDRTIRLNP
jgi:hypothetical protein